MRNFKVIASLLAFIWLFSCPVLAACPGSQGDCGQKCCENELSGGHCQAAVINDDSLSSELPDLAGTVPAAFGPVLLAELISPLIIVPDLALAVESKLHPHTGPPQI
ncbi:MAG: hypothetical protein WC632_01095 [Candidatus Margulisiibacteriota bacterium]